jgi:hypothetical protein
MKNEIADIKRAMKLCKPLAGYLGNQYFYWKRELEKLKKKNHKQ